MRRRLLLLLLATARPIAAQLAYDVPPGWTRSVNPNTGLVSLSPPPLRGGRVLVLTVFNPETVPGSAADYHNEIVGRVANNARQLEAPQHGTIGALLVTAVHELMATGAVLWIRIYTARWADQGQTFILSSNAPDVPPQYVLQADSLIARIVVPRAEVAAAAPAPAPSPTPPPAPPAPPAPLRAGQLDGVYLTLKNKGGYTYGVSKDFMVFFPDGQVFWHLPDEGLLGFDVARSHREWSEFWGHYEMQGERMHVAFNTGPSYDGRRNPNGSLELGGYTYIHQSSGPDGRALSGTYRAYNSGADPSMDVTFSPDGRFDDRGIRTVVGALDLAYGRAKVPTGPGKGRYRIARYSIAFEYSDGRREQLSFYVPDDDGSSTPRQLVINTFNLLRVAP